MGMRFCNSKNAVSFISEEFLAARTGEALEARQRDSGTFRQQMKSLHEASKAFSKDSGMLKKGWKLYDRLEDEWTKYDILYGEQAYRLGFQDGVQTASEREIQVKGSVLSFTDMTHLVYLDESVIRIGTSPMTPAQILVELWPKIHEHSPHIKFQLMPFDNTPENAREILANLGQNIDAVAGIFDETMLDLRKCDGFEMSSIN